MQLRKTQRLQEHTRSIYDLNTQIMEKQKMYCLHGSKSIPTKQCIIENIPLKSYYFYCHSSKRLKTIKN